MRQTPEKRAAYNREYRLTPENRQKFRAREMLQYSVRSGKISRLPCERCGAPNTQAHHSDYAQPLHVKWLCQPCHGFEHTQGFCKRGHLRTPENLNKRLDCRKCANIRARESRLRKKQIAGASPTSTIPMDIRIVRISNAYGEVRCIKVMQGHDVIGDAVMFSPARGRGVVWMMGCRDLEAEIEFPVVVSSCGNTVSLAVTAEDMLAAVELELDRLAEAPAPALQVAE